MYSIKSNLIWMLIFIIISLLAMLYLTGHTRTIVAYLFAWFSVMLLLRLVKLIKLGKDYRFILSAFSDGRYFKYKCDFCENHTDLTQTIGTHLIKKHENSTDKIEFYCLIHGNEFFNKIENEQRLDNLTLAEITIKAMTYANILRQGGFLT